MKIIQFFLIITILFIHISCVTRGEPIENQVVYYMENFDPDHYTKFQIDNGDVVYYPNEIIKLVDLSELYNFNSNHYQKIKIKRKTYFIPKNRLLIQQVQNIRQKSKFNKPQLDVSQPNELQASDVRDEFETITVGEPYLIEKTSEPINTTTPLNQNPLEQIAH